MDIPIQNLPPYESISQPDISKASAAFSATKAAVDQAGKDVVELEQTREAAEWRDAEAAEAAQAAGKPAPKRSEVAAHDKRTDEAKHSFKVAKLAHDRAERELETVLESRSDDWLDELTALDEKATTEWQKLVNSLTYAFNKLRQVRQLGRQVGLDFLNVAMVPLDRRQIEGLELAQGGPTVGHVHVEDLLAGLTELGKPTEPEKQPGLEWDQKGSPNMGRLRTVNTSAEAPEVVAFLERERAARIAEGRTLGPVSEGVPVADLAKVL